MREIEVRAYYKHKSQMVPVLKIGGDNGYFNPDYLTLIGQFPEEFDVMLFTGIREKKGKQRKIYRGDIVSFDGNMTADNSLGSEPNGFIYDETSVYEVIWDEELAAWNLRFHPLDSQKFRWMTRCLFVNGDCKIIGNISENPELL